MSLIYNGTTIPEIAGNIKHLGTNVREVIFKNTPAAAGQRVWFYNNPPSAPVITINPAPVNNFISPSLAGSVIVTAAGSVDPDGDTVTYSATRQAGSNAAVGLTLGQANSYAAGRQLIRAVASDPHGATNQAARLFFVGDSSAGNTVNFVGLNAIATEPGIDADFRITKWSYFAIVSEGHSSGNADKFLVYGTPIGGSERNLIDLTVNYSAYASGDNLTGAYSGYKDYRNASTNGNVATGGTAISGSFTTGNYSAMRFVYQVDAGHEGCIQSGTSRIAYTVEFEYIGT